MENLTKVNNIQELTQEVYNQLFDPAFYTHNYRMLTNLTDHLNQFAVVLGIEDWSGLRQDQIKDEIENYFENDYNGTLIDFPSEL